MVHSGQFENLLHGRLRIEEADSAFSAAGGLVQGNQCAESTTIDKGRLGQIDFNVLLPVRQCCARLISEVIGISGAKLQDPGDSHCLTVMFDFHGKCRIHAVRNHEWTRINTNKVLPGAVLRTGRRVTVQ